MFDQDSTLGGWQSTANHEVLLERALMLKNIRAFFDARNVMEVETPLLSHSSTTDPHLDSLQSRFRDQRCYLNTSPEYGMKRLLANNPVSIYQICKAFRDDELGDFHNPEFTLLEWYRLDYDCEKLMDELQELLEDLCKQSKQFTHEMIPFQRLSYQQAFENTVEFNPHQATSSECYHYARNHGVEIPQGLDENDELDDWLDWLLTQRVLPAFQKDAFTFLYDYPVSQCALAKIGRNTQNVPIAKRFELFYGEIELANGFHELTDPVEQLQRFKLENNTRKCRGKEMARIDKHFIAALDAGLAECSGLALGLDRVLMVLVGAENIEQVLSFSWERA